MTRRTFFVAWMIRDGSVRQRTPRQQGLPTLTEFDTERYLLLGPETQILALLKRDVDVHVHFERSSQPLVLFLHEHRQTVASSLG